MKKQKKQKEKVDRGDGWREEVDRGVMEWWQSHFPRLPNDLLAERERERETRRPRSQQPFELVKKMEAKGGGALRFFAGRRLRSGRSWREWARGDNAGSHA